MLLTFQGDSVTGMSPESDEKVGEKELSLEKVVPSVEAAGEFLQEYSSEERVWEEKIQFQLSDKDLELSEKSKESNEKYVTEKIQYEKQNFNKIMDELSAVREKLGPSLSARKILEHRERNNSICKVIDAKSLTFDSKISQRKSRQNVNTHRYQHLLTTERTEASSHSRHHPGRGIQAFLDSQHHQFSKNAIKFETKDQKQNTIEDVERSKFKNLEELVSRNKLGSFREQKSIYIRRNTSRESQERHLRALSREQSKESTHPLKTLHARSLEKFQPECKVSGAKLPSVRMANRSPSEESVETVQVSDKVTLPRRFRKDSLQDQDNQPHRTNSLKVNRILSNSTENFVLRSQIDYRNYGQKKDYQRAEVIQMPKIQQRYPSK